MQNVGLHSNTYSSAQENGPAPANPPPVTNGLSRREFRPGTSQTSKNACRPEAPPKIPDHELLRCIGSGAYGDVWLARSVTGVYRAVKVVYRQAFPEDRPYEREFKGIQKFEPISRTHESQVDILHVGRNDAEGYFYYVMELADDASGECGKQTAESSESVPHLIPRSILDPNSYVPHTLKRELQQRGRLPVQTCIEIGLSLTTALEHLHGNGLVHRDIKPSNIIFIDGKPKLADIGLVTDLDATVSFVGTEGYIPREGPGTAQADIYSLGKVLYELCTGKDRQQFPEPPTAWEGSADEQTLRELHEILLRACERDARERYQSVREIRADLALLQTGKSVKRLHLVERRLAISRRVGAAALAVTVFATAAFLYQRKLTLRAERAEQAARENLRAAYLGQAEAAHFGGRAGQRFESLAALAKAAQIRPGPDLRDEAIRIMAMPDVRPATEQTRESGANGHVTFDQNFEYAARGDSEGNITVCRLRDGQQIANLPGSGIKFSYQVLKMSPDGRFVAVRYNREYQQNLFRVWSVERKEQILEIREGVVDLGFDFSVDSHWLAFANRNPCIVIYDLRTGRERNRFDAPFTTECLRFSPDGRKLAIARSDEPVLERRDAETGKLEATMKQPGGVQCLDWHPNGRILAVACNDHRIHVWDTSTGEKVTELEGHHAEAVLVAFSHGGDLLASYGWDSAIRLWAEQEIVSLGRGALTLHFNHNDRWLGEAADGKMSGVLEVCSAPECRTLWGHSGRGVGSAACSPDGHLLATLGQDGVRLWDLRTQHEIDFLPTAGGYCALFAPVGKSLIVCGHAGAQRVPINCDADGTTYRIGIAAAEAVELPTRGLERAALSADGRFFVVACPDQARAWVLDLARRGRPVIPLRHKRCAYVSISRDGKWAATGAWGGTGVKVWEAQTGRLLADLPVEGKANVAFSPDGRWLVTGARGEFGFWETGSWQQRRAIPRDGRDWVGIMAFSPDGSMLAITHVRSGIRLVETETGRNIATLTGDDQWPLCFSPDGTKLIAGCWKNLVRIWDLHLIRQQLAAMNLDWESPDKSRY